MLKSVLTRAFNVELPVFAKGVRLIPVLF